MAKICNNILLGNKHFFRNLKGELICNEKGSARIIMEKCIDFDGAVKGEELHIAASDGEKLVYILNIGDRWGKGILAEGLSAENLFICIGDKGATVHYVSGEELYRLDVEDKGALPVFVAQISTCAMPFAAGTDVYYINSEGMLCKNDREIRSGKEISFIFATGSRLCIKEGNRLLIADSGTPGDQKSLTKRHGRRAECPLVVNTREGEILCWKDGNLVLSSVRNSTGWQRLEEEQCRENERTEIFKFCEKNKHEYALGRIVSGQVTKWGEIPRENPPEKAEELKAERNIKEEFHRQLQMEHILGGIREIHQRILELDGKIEKLNRAREKEVITKISKPVNKRNLYKVHKK